MSLDKPSKKFAIKLLRPLRSFSQLLDQIFFVFAGLASLWLAWLVFREGLLTGGWWLVGLFVVVWIITAYLALPRLHLILSSIYVPNYFIGRTRTADGILSDPVNLGFRGSEAQLHKTMTEAGWKLADDITLRSAWRMIATTLGRRSYANAPVSPAFLFGRRQDFTYQQEVDGNPKQRHHVRFWHCPTGWLLPGGHRVDWLAAGTYDRSVGLSLFTFQITHRIDEDIDIERDYIIESVKNNDSSIRVAIIRDFSTGYHSRNGGGDSIRTDGDLPILELSGEVDGHDISHRVGVIMDGTVYDRPPVNSENLLLELWSRRPPQIFFGSALMAILMFLTTIQVSIDLINWQSLLGDFAGANTDFTLASLITAGSVMITFAVILVEILLVALLFSGNNRARIALLAVASLTIIAESLTMTVGRITMASAASLALIGAHIMIVMLFSSDAARSFTEARSRER